MPRFLLLNRTTDNEKLFDSFYEASERLSDFVNDTDEWAILKVPDRRGKSVLVATGMGHTAASESGKGSLGLQRRWLDKLRAYDSEDVRAARE